MDAASLLVTSIFMRPSVYSRPLLKNRVDNEEGKESFSATMLLAHLAFITRMV